MTALLDARRWAVSKLRLWLEDSTSKISTVMCYPLRDAHRRYTAFLGRALGVAEDGRRMAALQVCKARGLLRARVDESNDEGEDPLVAAVTDGAATADIQLLIAAGCAVNGAEGKASMAVLGTAMYGNAAALGALLEAKATVNGSTKVVTRWESVLLRDEF